MLVNYYEQSHCHPWILINTRKICSLVSIKYWSMGDMGDIGRYRFLRDRYWKGWCTLRYIRVVYVCVGRICANDSTDLELFILKSRESNYCCWKCVHMCTDKTSPSLWLALHFSRFKCKAIHHTYIYSKLFFKNSY